MYNWPSRYPVAVVALLGRSVRSAQTGSHSIAPPQSHGGQWLESFLSTPRAVPAPIHPTPGGSIFQGYPSWYICSQAFAPHCAVPLASPLLGPPRHFRHLRVDRGTATGVRTRITPYHGYVSTGTLTVTTHHWTWTRCFLALFGSLTPSICHGLLLAAAADVGLSRNLSESPLTNQLFLTSGQRVLVIVPSAFCRLFQAASLAFSETRRRRAFEDTGDGVSRVNATVTVRVTTQAYTFFHAPCASLPFDLFIFAAATTSRRAYRSPHQLSSHAAQHTAAEPTVTVTPTAGTPQPLTRPACLASAGFALPDTITHSAVHHPPEPLERFHGYSLDGFAPPSVSWCLICPPSVPPAPRRINAPYDPWKPVTSSLFSSHPKGTWATQERLDTNHHHRRAQLCDLQQRTSSSLSGTGLPLPLSGKLHEA